MEISGKTMVQVRSIVDHVETYAGNVVGISSPSVEHAETLLDLLESVLEVRRIKHKTCSKPSVFSIKLKNKSRIYINF